MDELHETAAMADLESTMETTIIREDISGIEMEKGTPMAQDQDWSRFQYERDRSNHLSRDIRSGLKKQAGDGLERSINRWKQQRDSKRQEILARKRKTAQQERKQLKLALLNVRGANSRIKREQLGWDIEKNQPDIVAFTETKLMHTWKMGGYISFQTRYGRSQGVWCGVKGQIPVKMVKTVDANIVWTCSQILGNFVHVITCYIPGGRGKNTRQIVNKAIWMVDCIRQKEPHAIIILQGDFNMQREMMDQMMEQRNMQPVISKAQETHILGNQLDQVYTNAMVRKYERVWPEYTDHALIMVDLDIEKRVQQHTETVRSQMSIRKMANSKIVKEALEQSFEHLNKPLMETFGNQIKNPPPQRYNWYEKPDPMFVNGNASKVTSSWSREMKKQWGDALKRVESAYNKGDMKVFHAMSSRLVKSRPKGTPVLGLSVGVDQLQDGNLVMEQVRRYYGNQMEGMESGVQTRVQSEPNMAAWNQLNLGDILWAIDDCNFAKAIGPDGFSGEVLKGEDTKNRFAAWLLETLRKNGLPQYLHEDRLIMLSKDAGNQYPAVENTRPIVIRSHIVKIVEKAVLKNIEMAGSELLSSASFQTGFKKGVSTHRNLTVLLKHILCTRRKMSGRVAYVFLDLQKAYDRVIQGKMMEILERRCKSVTDQNITEMIRQLTLQNWVSFNGKKIADQKTGLVQGGVLSPLLFNVYLEDALKRQTTLSKLIDGGRLAAFADDIMVMVQGKEEMEQMLVVVKKMEDSHNLKLNVSKSQFITDAKKLEGVSEVAGVRRSDSFKYLGVEICTNRQKMVKGVLNVLRHQVMTFHQRLRVQSLQVQNILYLLYVRSQVIYHLTPIVAAGLLEAKDVRKVEAEHRIVLYGVPGDIKRQVLTNLTVLEKESVEAVVMRLAGKVNRSMPGPKQQKLNLSEEGWSIGQEKLDHPERNKTAPEQDRMRRRLLYMDRNMLRLILAVTQNRTVLQWGHQHYCSKHRVMVDKFHIGRCDLISELGDVRKFNSLLETRSVKELSRQQQVSLMTLFGWLQNRIMELEDKQIFRVIRQQFRVTYVARTKSKAGDTTMSMEKEKVIDTKMRYME